MDFLTRLKALREDESGAAGVARTPASSLLGDSTGPDPMPMAVLEGEIAAVVESTGDDELRMAYAHLAGTGSIDDHALIGGELRRRGLPC